MKALFAATIALALSATLAHAEPNDARRIFHGLTKRPTVYGEALPPLYCMCTGDPDLTRIGLVVIYRGAEPDHTLTYRAGCEVLEFDIDGGELNEAHRFERLCAPFAILRDSR